jgi:hypothetical protein
MNVIFARRVILINEYFFEIFGYSFELIVMREVDRL